LRRCRLATVRIRYLIVINLLNGRSAYQTAKVLHVHNTTVYRVARRFHSHGEWALYDAREDKGPTKLDDNYLAVLYRVVRGTPSQYGWRRPTWTHELLIETLVGKTGVRIHVTTMSRALALVKARRGRPRPTVAYPWAKRSQSKKSSDRTPALAVAAAGSGYGCISPAAEMSATVGRGSEATLRTLSRTRPPTTEDLRVRTMRPPV
jgi:transposase